MRPRRPARPRPSGRERRARVARPRAMMRAGAKAWPRRRDGTSRRARRRRAWPRPSARGVCSGRTTASASASSASATAATRCSTRFLAQRTPRSWRVCDLCAAVPRLRRQEDGRRAEAVSRTTGDLLDRQGRRRRRHRHARPLARAADRSTRARPARTSTSRSRSRCAWPRAGAWSRRRDEHERVTQVGHPSALDARLRAKRRSSSATAASARSPSCAAFHVQNEWPKGIGNPPGRARRRASTGTRGSVRRRACRTTATAPSTASAGSTTTPAARSPTSACTTST